jgi:ferredoxin
MKRKIIKIDEEKCNGCGLCIPICPEGALQIIDNKVRIVSDLYCDGLGACLEFCPQGAITVEQREAEPYDERKVMVNIVKQGKNVIKAHLEHLKSHNQNEYLKEALDFLKEKGIEIELNAKSQTAFTGCPGTKIIEFMDIDQ